MKTCSFVFERFTLCKHHTATLKRRNKLIQNIYIPSDRQFVPIFEGEKYEGNQPDLIYELYNVKPVKFPGFRTIKGTLIFLLMTICRSQDGE